VSDPSWVSKAAPVKIASGIGTFVREAVQPMLFTIPTPLASEMVPSVIVSDCPDAAKTYSVTVGSVIVTVVRVTIVSVESRMLLAVFVLLIVVSVSARVLPTVYSICSVIVPPDIVES